MGRYSEPGDYDGPRLSGAEQEAAWELGEAIFEITAEYVRPVLLSRDDRERIWRRLRYEGWVLTRTKEE